MRILFIAGIITALFSCNSSSTEKEHNKGGHSANKHMHKSSFEELVKRFEDPTREEWQKPQLVLDKLGDINGKVIADIGAGTGYFSFKMADRGAKVLALDVDQRFIDYIKTNKGALEVEVIKVPFDNPLLDSASIDAAIIVDTYHHIENRPEYFSKVLKGIKSGGKLLVVDFKKEETPHGPPANMRLSGYEVIKELQKVGFSKVIIDTKTLPYQYIISAKKA